MIQNLSILITNYIVGRYADPIVVYYLIANGICVQSTSDNAHIRVVKYGKRVIKVTAIGKYNIYQAKEYFKSFLGLLTVDLTRVTPKLVLSKKAIPFTIGRYLDNPIILDESEIRTLF